MGCGSGCGCGDNDSSGISRREVLGAFAAAAVSLSVLAQGAAADVTTTPTTDPGAAGDWLKTIKASDLADNSAKNILGHPVVLTRTGQTILALSSKCTHKGGTVKALPTQKDTLACPLHFAQFDFAGTNTAGPRGSPPSLHALSRYALRLNADGIIEVDTSRHLTADDKETILTLPA
jgi:nitrite reductase/ring-hydroxylating ferredoxin subunit